MKCCACLSDLLNPRFFKALCDPNRISILAKIVQEYKSSSVSQIADCCPVDRSVVSRHLAVLRDAGILNAQKRGKEVFYSVDFKTLVGSLRAMAAAIEACCVSSMPSNKSDKGARPTKERKSK